MSAWKQGVLFQVWKELRLFSFPLRGNRTNCEKSDVVANERCSMNVSSRRFFSGNVYHLRRRSRIGLGCHSRLSVPETWTSTWDIHIARQGPLERPTCCCWLAPVCYTPLRLRSRTKSDNIKDTSRRRQKNSPELVRGVVSCEVCDTRTLMLN